MDARNIYTFVCGVAILVISGSGVLCAPQCLTGDFDSQLQQILQAQMLSAQDPIVTRVLDDVRATLDQRWQGYELILCGSLGTGLGTIASDIDLFVELPNFNSSAGLYVLEETVKVFNKRPELYTGVKFKENPIFKSAFFAIYHIPSRRTIEFEFDIVVLYKETQKNIKYYFELDKRFKPLGVFLKYWFGVHDITGHGPGYLPGHALYLLIIFYLQQKNMAPPGYVLQVNSSTSFMDGWNLGFNELPYSTTNTDNLHQLLGGFFKYYSEFNFEEYIVSPFTGRPIPKNTFTDIDKFPKEYTLYKNTLNRTMQITVKNYLDTEMSIQDMYMHDKSCATKISHERVTKFKYLMKLVATMFEELPSDRILSAILVADEHTNNTMDGINDDNCFVITDRHVGRRQDTSLN